MACFRVSYKSLYSHALNAFICPFTLNSSKLLNSSFCVCISFRLKISVANIYRKTVTLKGSTWGGCTKKIIVKHSLDGRRRWVKVPFLLKVIIRVVTRYVEYIMILAFIHILWSTIPKFRIISILDPEKLNWSHLKTEKKLILSLT